MNEYTRYTNTVMDDMSGYTTYTSTGGYATGVQVLSFVPSWTLSTTKQRSTVEQYHPQASRRPQTRYKYNFIVFWASLASTPRECRHTLHGPRQCNWGRSTLTLDLDTDVGFASWWGTADVHARAV
ncbi:hypothetical protein PC116_g6882 [Phytophthora cactorum]|nr:hypothetical protein PC116_g6882 [Phytophthora cactorum]